MTELNKKEELLRRRFREIGSAVIAFSGGVDSSVLVGIAHQELGENMSAVTSISASFPKDDRDLAQRICEDRSIPHHFIESAEFADSNFTSNPESRCYYCKKNLYKALEKFADKHKYKYIVEGTNSSDLGGHRPGYKASCENERVLTPLIDYDFTKSDVRMLAEKLELEVANKPSAACLSSRVPTNVEITPSLLRKIDDAESYLRSIGLGQVRVRHNGEIARIETDIEGMRICLNDNIEIYKNIKNLGWKFVCLDLIGYREGGARK